MISKFLGLSLGVILCTIAFVVFVQSGTPTQNERKLFGIGLVASILAGTILSASLDLKVKWEKLDKKHREILYQINTLPQCFNLQEAVDQRLTEVAIRWHEYSQKFVEKGTDVAINSQVETFNRLYSMIEDTFSDDKTLLREKDIRSYLPEKFRKAS